MDGSDFVYIGLGIGALVLLSDVGDTVKEGGVAGLIVGNGGDFSDSSDSSLWGRIWNNPFNVLNPPGDWL